MDMYSTIKAIILLQYGFVELDSGNFD